MLTAWHMLIGRARLRPGETVLVQAGGSGIGTAAIQIAKLWGAVVYTTAGSGEKTSRAKELGADAAINYRDVDFVAEVRALTGKRGVDIVVEHVGGETFERSMRVLARGGRLVTCGATTGAEVSINLRAVFFKLLSVLGSTMGSLAELHEIMKHVEAGRLRPVVDRILPLEQVAEARDGLALAEKQEPFGVEAIVQHRDDSPLQFGVVDTYGARGEFDAVEHKVEGMGAQLLQLSGVAASGRIPLGEGEDDPAEEAPHGLAWRALPARRSGYIVSVDTGRLLAWAAERDVVLRMELGVGEFAIASLPIASIAGPAPDEEKDGAALDECYSLADERTIEQDPEFGIQQIIDVAVRALSPGVNDPTTARMCIHHLTGLLVRLARRRKPSRLRYRDDKLRVVAKAPDFTSLCTLAFDALARYAEGKPEVLATLREGASRVASAAPPSRRAALAVHLPQERRHRLNVR